MNKEFTLLSVIQLGRNCIATEILICDGNVYQVSVRLAHLPIKYKARACLCMQTGGMQILLSDFEFSHYMIIINEYFKNGFTFVSLD